MSRPAPGELDAAVESLRRSRAVALPFLSPAYPPRLANLRDPAPLLLVRGDVGALAAPSVAIVGSRAATAYGLSTARELAAGLARAGLIVVSGLARGIDAAAHLGALEAGGRTVAVQACGPDRVYPATHRELANRIADCGAIVAELPPGTPPRGEFFPLRNRMISGLALALVVVEARERSGSLITAAHALDQGRDVLAVPGPVNAPTSAGPNRLLRDGAFPALEIEDVLGVLGPGPASPAERRASAARARRARGQRSPAPTFRNLRRCLTGRSPRVSPEARAIVRALLREPATRDELGRRLERAPEQLALDLLELELEGRVVEDRDGRLRVVSRRGTRV